MQSKPQNEGQVLIIVVLVMIVGLTIGFFLLNRTTTDISLTNKLEDSTRAFNAAEIGVEEAIFAGGGSSPLPVPTGLSYSVSLGTLTAASNVVYPGIASATKLTAQGDLFTLWLVPHNDATGALNEAGAGYKNNNLDVCFTSSSPTLPAIGITAYYKDTSVVPNKYRASFVGFDPNDARNVNGSNGGNHFKDVAATSGGCGTNGYTYRAALQLSSDFGDNLTQGSRTPLALRIRPYYASTKIAVIPSGNSLPKQGNQIESRGTSGQTERKIEVTQRYTVPAPFLDHAVFNTGSTDITK